MAKGKHLGVICFTIFAVVLPAGALKCYKCAGAKCGDPFDRAQASTVDCDGLCMKRKITGFSSKEAEMTSPMKTGDALRHCYTHSTVKPECEEVEEKGVKGVVCYCHKDLCNAGCNVKVTMTTFIMTTAAIILCLLFERK